MGQGSLKAVSSWKKNKTVRKEMGRMKKNIMDYETDTEKNGFFISVCNYSDTDSASDHPSPLAEEIQGE